MTVIWHRPAKRSIGPLEAIAGLGLLALLVARFIPVAKILPFWGCPLRRMTGFPCLGCGLTRAFDRVSHFNIAGAVDANPLGAAAAIFAAFLALYAIAANVWLFPRPGVELSPGEWRATRWTVAVVLAVNWAYVIVRTLST